MVRLLLLSLAVAAPAALAQKPAAPTDAAEEWVASAYDAVMDGVAFTFRFDGTFRAPDSTLTWAGTATTYAEPPDGWLWFRMDYDDGEIDAEGLAPSAYYARMPRTGRVYVDSTSEALQDDVLRTLLRLHPALSMGLDNLAQRTVRVDGPVAAKVEGRDCQTLTFHTEGGNTIAVCFDTVTRMPLQVHLDFRSDGDMRVRYSPAVPIDVPAPEVFALAPLGDYRYAPYDGASQPRLAVGQPVPDFELAGPDGTPVRLSRFRGQTVLLDFWGSWCSPCVAALPAMAALADANPRLVVLGLASHEEDGVDPVAFARARGAMYPILRATGDVLDLFRVHVFPTYYVVGPDGTLLFEGIHDEEDEIPVEERLGAFLTTLSTLTGGF